MSNILDCPECGKKVLLPKDGKMPKCRHCGAKFKSSIAKVSVEEEEEETRRPTKSPGKKKKKKKKKGPPPWVLPAAVGGAVVLMIGIVVTIYLVSGPNTKNNNQNQANNQPNNSLPGNFNGAPNGAVGDWLVKEDPRAASANPGEIKLEAHNASADLYRSALQGDHLRVLFGTEPGKPPVYRHVNLFTGKSVVDLPLEMGKSVLSDDGTKLIAITKSNIPAPKRGSAPQELQILDSKTKNVLRKTLLNNPNDWYDFGKTADVLFIGSWNSVTMYDLRDETMTPKGLQFSRPIGRTGGQTSVSPNRNYLAVNGERHVEIFSMKDGSTQGLIECPGQALRCAFSGNGKELTVLSMMQNLGKGVEKQTIPHYWITYSMATGKEVRRVESTVKMVGSFSTIEMSHDPEVVTYTMPTTMNYFDIREGATITSVNRRHLGAFDQNNYFAYNQQTLTIQIEPIAVPQLAEARKELKRILGERAPVFEPKYAEAKLITPGKAWSVPVDPFPEVAGGPENNVQGPANCEFIPPRADASVWGALTMRREEEPRLRYSYNWIKITPDGKTTNPIELLPSALKPGLAPVQFGFSTSKFDQSKAGDLCALRDPKELSRIDIWQDDGKRLLGFHPSEKKADVTWLAWANGDRLLTLADRALMAWDGRTGKAIFRTEAKYNGAYLSPTRRWVALLGATEIDFHDSETGQHLGTITTTTTGGIGVSQDGKRLLLAKSLARNTFGPGQQKYYQTEYSLWDLQQGKAIRGDKYVSSRGAKMGQTLFELSETNWLIDNEILDFECNAAPYAAPISTLYDFFQVGMVGRRMWVPLGSQERNQPTWVTVNQLLTYNFGNDPANLPKLKKEDIVFRPGTKVRVVASLKSPGREGAATDAITAMLKNDGFEIGDGGFVIQISAESGPSGEKLMDSAGGEVSVPRVLGKIELVSPSGERLSLSSISGSFSSVRSKYVVSTKQEGNTTVTRYNFGGDPATVMLNEVWKDAMNVFSTPIPYPIMLGNVNNKLTPLPIYLK